MLLLEHFFQVRFPFKFHISRVKLYILHRYCPSTLHVLVPQANAAAATAAATAAAVAAAELPEASIAV